MKNNEYVRIKFLQRVCVCCGCRFLSLLPVYDLELLFLKGIYFYVSLPIFLCYLNSGGSYFFLFEPPTQGRTRAKSICVSLHIRPTTCFKLSTLYARVYIKKTTFCYINYIYTRSFLYIYISLEAACVPLTMLLERSKLIKHVLKLGI